MPVHLPPRSPAASASFPEANTPDFFAEFTTFSPSPAPITSARLSPQAFTPAPLNGLLHENLAAFDADTLLSSQPDSPVLDYDFFRDPSQLLSAPETAAATPQPTRPASPVSALATPLAPRANKRPNIWHMNNVMVTRLRGTKAINPATGQPYMKGDSGTPEGMMTYATYMQQRLVNPEDGTVMFNPHTKTPYISGDTGAPPSGMRYDVYNRKRLVNPDTGELIFNPMTQAPFMEGDPHAPQDAVTFIARQRIGTKRKRQEKAAAAQQERAAKRVTKQQSSTRKTLPALQPKPS